MTNHRKSLIYEWAGTLYDSTGFMVGLIMFALVVLVVNFLMGCAAQPEKVVQADFDAGGRPCRYSEWHQVVTVSCDPEKPFHGNVEVFQPVVAPREHEDGTMLSVFQDLLDLKIFQPTLIEGSGLTVWGGGG